MKKRYLTLDDLCGFYQKNFSSNATFNAKEAGGPVVVHAEDMGYFEEYKSDENLLYLKFKAAHTGINRNGSRISEENMQKAMPSLKYRPVLAYIVEDENGELDFDTHNMTINDDDTVTYQEHQVGCFTADEPVLEYDEDNDKTYVIAYAAIPEDYTETANILKRKNGTKVSCELCINSMSYDAKEKVLDLNDFFFSGITLLGEAIGEGMQGSRADIVSLEDFSVINNSVVSLNDQIINKLDQLHTLVNDLKNTMTNEEGGDTSVKLNELLEKYGKTVEDLDFDYKSMSDEELEAKFEELFGEENGAEDPSEEPEANENEQSEADTYTLNINGREYNFSTSLNERLCALEQLVNETYSEADNTYYCTRVYDEYVVMIDYWTNRAYRQGYTVDGDTYSLSGEREEVYCNYLTRAEEDALAELKSSYAAMETKLKAYESAESAAQKEAIFNSEDYADISENEDFKALVAEAEKYSVEEIQTKCDNMLLAYVKENKARFASSQRDGDENTKSRRKVNIGASKEPEYSPYGTLFADYKRR